MLIRYPNDCDKRHIKHIERGSGVLTIDPDVGQFGVRMRAEAVI